MEARDWLKQVFPHSFCAVWSDEYDDNTYYHRGGQASRALVDFLKMKGKPPRKYECEID